MFCDINESVWCATMDVCANVFLSIHVFFSFAMFGHCYCAAQGLLFSWMKTCVSWRWKCRAKLESTSESHLSFWIFESAWKNSVVDPVSLNFRTRENGVFAERYRDVPCLQWKLLVMNQRPAIYVVDGGCGVERGVWEAEAMETPKQHLLSCSC